MIGLVIVGLGEIIVILLLSLDIGVLVFMLWLYWKIIEFFIGNYVFLIVG